MMLHCRSFTLNTQYALDILLNSRCQKGIIRVTVMMGTHKYRVFSICPTLHLYFISMVSLHFYNNSVRKMFLLIPFYR